MVHSSGARLKRKAKKSKSLRRGKRTIARTKQAEGIVNNRGRPIGMPSFGSNLTFPSRAQNNENVDRTNTSARNGPAPHTHRKRAIRSKAVSNLAAGISQALSQRREVQAYAAVGNSAKDNSAAIHHLEPRGPAMDSEVTVNKIANGFTTGPLEGERESIMDLSNPDYTPQVMSKGQAALGDLKASSGPMLTNFLEHSPTKEEQFFVSEEGDGVSDEASISGDDGQHVLFIDQDKIMTGKEPARESTNNDVLDARLQTQLRQLLVYLRTNPEGKAMLCDGEQELNDILDLCFDGGRFGVQVLAELIATNNVCWQDQELRKATEFVQSHTFEETMADPEMQACLLASLEELHPCYNN